MKDITPYIKKSTNEIMLSHSERAHMKRVVHEYIAMKPLPSGEVSSISIDWFSLSWIKQPIAAALALVFIFGSGVSFAAEGALPGDTLYSVKTNVNEPVKVALATNAEAKANIQIKLAERRIEEAAALAAENRLDADTESALAVAFESHAQEATNEVVGIDEEDSSAAAEISSRFETRLAAHEAVLALVSANADATNTLSVAIRGAGLAVADIRARAEERAEVSAPIAAATMAMAVDAAPAMETMSLKAAAAPEADVRANVATTNVESNYNSRTAERMRTSAEAQVKVAQKKLKSAKIDEPAKAEAEIQISLARDLIETGHDLLSDKAVAQAYHSFQNSLIISEKLNVMLNAATSLKKASARPAIAEKNERSDARTQMTSGARAKARESVNAATHATATVNVLPVQVDIGADATVTHDVSPVLPAPIQIFVPKVDIDLSSKGGDFINIGL